MSKSVVVEIQTTIKTYNCTMSYEQYMETLKILLDKSSDFLPFGGHFINKRYIIILKKVKEYE